MGLQQLLLILPPIMLPQHPLITLLEAVSILGEDEEVANLVLEGVEEVVFKTASMTVDEEVREDFPEVVDEART